MSLSEDELVEIYKRGELRFLEIPTAMINHVFRYGLLPKKSPDGSREIRSIFSDITALEDKSSTWKPTDPIRLSHRANTVKHLFCGFEHGPHKLTHMTQTLPNHFNARMSLAQLRELAQNCLFCEILVVGIDRHRGLWQPPFEKRRYQDNVYNRRDDIECNEYWALLTAADNFDFDDRYMLNSVSDKEVALSVDYISNDPGVTVRVQKYPHPDFDRMETQLVLEFFVADGMLVLLSISVTPPIPP